MRPSGQPQPQTAKVLPLAKEGWPLFSRALTRALTVVVKMEDPGTEGLGIAGKNATMLISKVLLAVLSEVQSSAVRP